MYLPNDKYSGLLSSGYTVDQNVLYASAVPTNVPTLIVAAKGTDDETVFIVTGKTVNSLTGVSRLKGANVDLDVNTPLTCLNNEEFIKQLIDATTPEHNDVGTHKSALVTTLKATGAEINTGTEDAKIVTPKAIADSNLLFTADVPVKATGAEIDTGTNDTKFVTPKALADSALTPAWTAYTPTHSRAGTDYSNLPTTNSARYLVEGKKVTLVVNFTQHGTPGGTSVMMLTTPVGLAPAVTTAVICFDGSSGKALTGQVSTGGTIGLYLYDGNVECSASHAYEVIAIYEIA